MYKLRPYQEAGVQQALKFDLNALLAADMGLGKTIIALDCLRRVKSAWPALVICPSNVKWGWQAQAANHLNIHATVLEGERPKRLQPSRYRIYVLNYDILQYWERALRKVPFGCLIADECQNLANPDTERTISCQNLASNIPHFLALSGTPLMNRPRELYPTLNIINPGEWGSFHQFARKFCDPKLTPWGWTYNGASNLDQLNAKLNKKCMIRIVKHEVEKLPTKHRSIEIVQLHNGHEYQEAVSDFAKWLCQKGKGVVSKKARKALELSKLAHLRMLVARLKARSVVAWIDDWLANRLQEKLIVVGWHRQMLQVLHRRCACGSIVVDGSTRTAVRKQFVERLKFDKSIRLLLGNINSVGVGVDGLQHVANTIAFAELPWRPSDVVQAEDRLFRIGQERETQVHYLISAGTIEAKLCRMLQLKQGVVSTVLDGKSRAGDLAIHDQLMRELVEEEIPF